MRVRRLILPSFLDLLLSLEVQIHPVENMKNQNSEFYRYSQLLIFDIEISMSTNIYMTPTIGK